MEFAIMGSLDGRLKRVAFDIASVSRIVAADSADMVLSPDQQHLFLKSGDQVWRVEGEWRGREPGAYFIVLHSGRVYNVVGYELLCDVETLPNDLLVGTDPQGCRHFCQCGDNSEKSATSPATVCLEDFDVRLESGEVTAEEIRSLKDMVVKLRRGEFFEALTMEFSGRIKEIAHEMISFREDIQRKIEPGIVNMASRDIPEASSQLEGINETLEKCTMKLMDINEAQLEVANRQAEELKSLMNANGSGTQDGMPAEVLDMIDEITAILAGLPEDVQPVTDFIKPGLDEGRRLIERQAVRDQVRTAMSEPLMTVQDLVQDVGEENADMARLNAIIAKLNQLFANSAGDPGTSDDGSGPTPVLEVSRQVLASQMAAFEKISQLSMSMSEPLSFQDLVGQRIQKIIKLVQSMEVRIEDLIISFGIKMQGHRKDPTQSFEDLSREVEEYKAELKGPSRDGDGLNQDSIDELLASL